MSNPARRELRDRVIAASRRHHAAYTLFNQTLANRLGLHPTDLQCLSLLDLEPEPLTVSQIAALTGLTSGSATRLVDRLEAAGLVQRLPDPTDRRKSLVALVRLHEVDRAWDEPGKAFSEAIEGYTDTELVVIADYLRRSTEVGVEQAKRLHGG